MELGKQQEQMGASPGGGELASLGAVQFALVETFTSSGTAGDFLALGQPVGNFGSVENLAASPGVESLGSWRPAGNFPSPGSARC